MDFNIDEPYVLISIKNCNCLIIYFTVFLLQINYSSSNMSLNCTCIFILSLQWSRFHALLLSLLCLINQLTYSTIWFITWYGHSILYLTSVLITELSNKHKFSSNYNDNQKTFPDIWGCVLIYHYYNIVIIIFFIVPTGYLLYMVCNQLMYACVSVTYVFVYYIIMVYSITLVFQFTKYVTSRIDKTKSRIANKILTYVIYTCFSTIKFYISLLEATNKLRKAIIYLWHKITIIHFVYEVWYKYLLSCEWRKGREVSSQWVPIYLFIYCFVIYCYYTYYCYSIHINGYLTNILTNNYTFNYTTKWDEDLNISRLSNMENNKIANVSSLMTRYSGSSFFLLNHYNEDLIIVPKYLLSPAINVCICLLLLSSYCYVHSLERCQFFSIHFHYMYNTCRHVHIHNTAKGKYQGGGLQIVYIHPWVYSKFTDYG